MLFLNIKKVLLIIVCFVCFSCGEQQLSPNEFLQYFSTAAGINSLIFSLSNTIYSIKKFNQIQKKSRGFNEGINDSISRSKELKSRNQVVNDNNGLNYIDILNPSNEEVKKNDIDIAHLINQTNNLTDIEMVEHDMVDGTINTDFKREHFKDLTGHRDHFFYSNNSLIENLNHTISQNIDTNAIISRNFRGLVIK